MRKLLEFIRSIYVMVLFVVLEAIAVSYYAHSTYYTQARLLARSNQGEGGVPCAGRLGKRVFLNYLIVLVLLHHAVFFSLEALSWMHVVRTLVRIVVSGAVSVAFIWIIARIFTAKLPVRV